MSKKKTGPVLFDEDFEVTYEDDSLELIDIEKDTKKHKGQTLNIPAQKKQKSPRQNRGLKEEKTVSKKQTVSHTEKIPAIKKVTKNSTPKAYGNRHIYDTSFYVIRTASIILAVSVFVLLTANFIRGAAPYGDITTLNETLNLELILYLAVAVFVCLFYGLMLLFSFKRERVVKKGRTYKLDMGKGTSTYVSLYILSYLSFIVCAILPDDFEFFGYTFLKGFAGALDVFGSMHNILLGMCVAGVIACKARKHMN